MSGPMIDEVLIATLAAHAAGAEGGCEVLEVSATPLPGGFVSKSVVRIDLTLRRGDTASFTASFVRKTCPAREAEALRLLARVPGASARPDLIAAGVSPDQPDEPDGSWPDGSWFVSPFYPGEALHFGDPIPTAVIETLARVHAATGAAPLPDWAWAFDAAHVDRLAVFAQRTLAASARFKAQVGDVASWSTRLEQAAASPALRTAAASLPRALTHGDMHPANIVRRADGSPVIIDWGNACAAPPVLDLANIVELGSPEWRAYVEAFEAAGGAFDEGVAERAFWWARAITALMYVPWAVDNSDRAPDLIAQLEDAAERLAKSG